MEQHGNHLISVNELADRLGCSADFVREKVRKGAWPHHRLSARMIKFSSSDVDAILRASERAPAQNSTLEELATAEKELELRKLIGATSLSITRRENRVRNLRIRSLLEQQASLGDGSAT